MVASLAGFVTLMIAHNLALGGDTMEMLRAVLDTNFWLATHVVVVTLGYASTFAAGIAGDPLHLPRRVHTAALPKDRGRSTTVLGRSTAGSQYSRARSPGNRAPDEALSPRGRGPG